MVDIPINDVTPRNRYIATGGQTIFDYDFPILDADQIKVQETDPLNLNAPVTLVRGVDYNVTGVGSETGGTIALLVGEYPTGATANDIYTLTRIVPYERLNDYQFSGDFESSDVNSDFDYLEMQVQQLARLLLGTARLDDTDELTSLPIKIETAARRGARVLGFNADGDGLETGPLFTDIDALGQYITEINAVGDNIASVVTVAGSIGNVNTVAASIAGVNTVAGSIANVNTVATNIANVNTVAGISAAVSTVAGVAAAVSTLAPIAANITTVAGISGNVTTVAGIAANVTTVAGIAANVTTVAGISAAVSTVAANITAVQNAQNNANIAKAAAGFTYTYSTTTTAADPGAGFVRFNNASLASATAMYISETTGLSQAIASEIATWDDSTSTIHGKLRVFKQSDPSAYVIYNVTGTNTDNGTWDTLTVGYVSGSGSIANNDPVTVQFVTNGDKGDIGPAGQIDFTTMTAEATIAANDYIVINDVSESASAVNKMLVSDFFKAFNLLTTTALAVGDFFPFYDISGSIAGKATLQTVYDFVNTLTAETAPATGDKLPMYDASASATDSITLDNLFKIIASLTSVTAPAIDDVLSIYDTSATVAGRMRFDDFFKVINGLTEDTTPDAANDFVVTYDASAGTAKKVKVQNVKGSGAPDFTSADITVTASSSTLVAHGLGVKPSRFEIIVKHTTAAGNYAVGDECPAPDTSPSGGNYYGTTGIIDTGDTTNIRVTTGVGLSLLNKTTGAGYLPTLSNLRYVVKAWK